MKYLIAIAIILIATSAYAGTTIIDTGTSTDGILVCTCTDGTCVCI